MEREQKKEEEEKTAPVWETLSAVNVNGHTETKTQNNVSLTYLSWAWAWSEVMKRYPDATYTIYKDGENRPFIYEDGVGFMVFTTVTIEGITREMWLPVMDGANRAMKKEPYTVQTRTREMTVAAATMMDINKAIMRCLTKNIAMFGLGLYIYAGEDLPEDDGANAKPAMNAQKADGNTAAKTGLEAIPLADAIAVAKGRMDACATRQELAAEWMKFPEAVRKDPGTVRFSQEKANKIKASEAAAAC